MAKNPDKQSLPANVDAERFVLGSFLLDEGFLSQCALAAEDFVLERHRRIFRRMLELRERSEKIDRVTVANELLRFDELDSVGGLSYLVSLDDGLPQIPDIGAYARILKDKTVLRKVVKLAHQAAAKAMGQEDPPIKILRVMGMSLAKIEASCAESAPLKTVGETIEAYEGGVQGFILNAIKPGTPSGFAQVDEHIMGLHPGSQYVIAGGPGSGKSAFVMNIAVSLAKRGMPGAVYSIEMSRELLLARMICTEAKIPIKAYLRRDLMSDQRLACLNAADRLSQLPLYIDETPSLNISQLATKVGSAVAQKDIKWYILDYLQLLDWQSDKDMRFRNEYEAVTYASRACVVLARKFGLISLILSQLSRPADKRKDAERPKLTDLRASGGIEQDAVAVLMIFREELYKPGMADLRGKAEILVRKSRMGTTGTANLEFIGKYTQFVDHGLTEGESE